MPNLGAMSGKPLPDRGLTLGTVTVRVARKTPVNGVPDTEVTALLEAAGGESRKRSAKTDAGGRATFEGLPVGQRFHAEIIVDGEKLVTDTFAIPEVGGVRTMLIAGLGLGGGERIAEAPAGPGSEAGTFPRTADPSVITVGTGARVILQLREDALGFVESLPLVNQSEKLFDPGSGGVEIPLPSEAVNVDVAEGEHKIDVRKGIGVAVHGMIPPRRFRQDTPDRNPPDEATFGFVMPVQSSVLEFEQRFPMGLGAFSLISDQVPDMTIESAQIVDRQEVEQNGKKFWLMRGEAIPAGGTLRFTVRGLPAPDATGRNLAGALALALMLTAAVFGRWRSGNKQRGAGGERERLVQRRERLFSELVAGENRRDRSEEITQRVALASIDPESKGGRAAKIDRNALLGKLEAVYRELAAFDEPRAI